MGIEARGIIYSAGGKTLLRGIDIDVAPRQLTGLVGPNGAGKTTLLRILAGVLTPNAGTLALDGRPRLPPRERARTLAYLAQGAEVNWALRADEVVALGRLPHHGRGGLSAGDERAVARALDAAGARHLSARTLDTLSGGERTRVLLARALAVEARFLLADEPVAALDPFHQLRIMEVLRAEARHGTGVVVVLHDLTLAHRFCDALVLMDSGRLVARGAPDAVLSDQHAQATYGVELLRGPAPGGTFVLPWTRLDTDGREAP